MKIICIIPARANSKGVANKNQRIVGGKELVRYTFELAHDCALLDKVVLSTDDDEIIRISRDYSGIEVPFKRPAALASDDAKTIDVVEHVLEHYNQNLYHPDAVLLLQVTSPLRSFKDIDNVIKIMNNDSRINSIVSIERIEEPHPYKMKTISNEGWLQPFIEGTDSSIPRQLLPPVYRLNGAIYLCRTSVLLKQHSFFNSKTYPYIMNQTINIDTENDIRLLELMLANNPQEL